MNWRKDLLARQSVYDSVVLAAVMYLAGLISLAACLQRDVFAFLVFFALLAIGTRKSWRLWHAIHRLARMQ